jgi:CubicO group peptidase (beta-lactamase class C family)
MAGRSSRIYNFCHSKPNSPGCPWPQYQNNIPVPPVPTNKQIVTVQKYLDANNAASKAPFSACTFGNAFTGNEVFIGSGNGGPNGEPIDPSMYWRLACQTKLIGQISLGAAIEDGIIESVDEPIYNYIPEVENITEYVSDSTAVVDSSGNPVYDNYGTPKYNQQISSDPNLGKSITIRMLLNHSAGFGYSFWGIGELRNTYINNFSSEKEGQNYIAWIQNIENNQMYAGTPTSSYDNILNVTYTDSIIERLKIPLLCRPGTSNIYGTEPTFLAAVISGALQKKGIQQTAAQYTQNRIFNPLGIKIWFNCGSLNPPSNVLTKLTNAFFVRQDTSPYILGSYQKGDNVNYDTLYSVFDINANGDGFKTQTVDVFTQQQINNYLSNDSYAGGYDWSGCGTMSDFCKILKLLINKGYNPTTKTQILSKQTVEWLLTSKYSPEKLALGLSAPNTGLINLLESSATWCGGYCKFMENTDLLPYPCGPNTYTWIGFFGTTFYFDTETGNYLMSGTQSFIGSWQLSTSTKSFEPNAAFIWKTLTSM